MTATFATQPFQAACERAGITNLRIHDLRHMATTILFLEGVPEAIIRKLTGHRSRELERYQHLSPMMRRQTVQLIARILSDTATDTGGSDQEGKSLEVIEINGGDDGARTRFKGFHHVTPRSSPFVFNKSLPSRYAKLRGFWQMLVLG
jgi:hypothetical protein